MRTGLKYAAALVTTYLVAWTVAYACMFLTRGDGLDFTHYFEYLALAWTFRAGELASFIWAISLMAFLPLGLGTVFVLRRYERSRKRNAEPTGRS
jgi:membrane protein implicated in regulation of membrane protease activity